MYSRYSLRSVYNAFFITFVISLSISCGGGEGTDEKTEQPQSIEELTAYKQTLQEQRDIISAQLREVDGKIATLQGVVETSTPVSVEEAVLTPFEHYLSLQCLAQTDKNIMMSAEIGGQTVSVDVKRGEYVKKNQVLVRLNSDVVDANISEVKTSLALSKTLYEKQKRLWDNQIGSEIQYLEIKNRYESLQQKLSTLEVQRSKFDLKAPFSGYVDEIEVKVGQLVSPGMPLLRIINFDRMYVESEIAESHLSVIDKSTLVKVVFEAFEGDTIQTNINWISQYINTNNRSFDIKANIPNAEKKIKPNMLGRIYIRDFAVDEAIVVQDRIIREEADGTNFVYVVQYDDKNEPRSMKKPVARKKTYEGMAWIEGLAEGDQIVVNGYANVREGSLLSF